MQRIGLLSFVALASGVRPGVAQEATGTTLWRVAAATVPTPTALAVGPAAAFWNPAQPRDSASVVLAVEAIQTPPAVDASGILATVRLPAGKVGEFGVIYGRVGLSDITQTLDSPDPTGSAVPVFTYGLGATWSRSFAATNLGATLAYHQTRLDTQLSERMTFDVGASHAFGDRFRIAAATHLLSSLHFDDPAQDIFAGAEARLWHGTIAGERAALRGRYGVAFAHGFRADQQFGVGMELAQTFMFDFLLAYEGSYGNGSTWRPVAGIRLAIGKYHLTLARDGGVNEVGSAYRVGLDARFK